MNVKDVLNVINQEWECVDYIEIATEIGKKHHGHYQPMPHIGDIDKPFQDEEWLYVPLEQNESWIPKQAWFQYDLLKAHGLPIDRVYIGHKPPKEKKKIELPQLPKIDTEPLVEVLKIAGMIALGMVTIVAYAMVTALTVVDPLFIVTFEGEKEWMLCIATWDE